MKKHLRNDMTRMRMMIMKLAPHVINQSIRDKAKNINLVAASIAIAGVLVAVVFGIWDIRLTYKIIDTSVDLKHFEALLSKTDSLLADQSKMLLDNGTLINLSQKQIDSLVSINKTLTNQFDVISKQYALTLH